jgi:acyl carrier protein
MADALRLEHIGVHNSFFDMGGHSLLATQVLSRINERFGIRFSLKDFFIAPTVAEVSETIKTILWATKNHPDIMDSAGSGREEMEL